MYLGSEVGARLKQERERNLLTVEQAAALSGATPEQWRALESGRLCMHLEFNLRLKNLGFSPRFIGLGERETFGEALGSDGPFIASHQLEKGAAKGEGDDALLSGSSLYAPDSETFGKAIELMRRSIAAVDAFVGEGSAAKSPELVAAVMNATLRSETQDDAQRISAAIENAATALCESIVGAAEAITVVAGDAIDALLPEAGG